MQRYILLRFWQAVVALLFLSMLVFLLARATGDPIYLMAPPDATQKDIAELRANLGLDRPLHIQYLLFISKAARGDLGHSMNMKRPVMDAIKERLPLSFNLAFMGMVLTLFIAFPLGVLAAVKRDTPVDTVAKVIAVLGQSIPSFWLALILIEVFGVRLRWFPVWGAEGMKHYVLPAITVALFILAGVMRLLRSSMLDILDSDFIKLARIEGVSNGMIVWKHALRNALIPVVTFAGMYFAISITALVVVETVFAWPGLGRLAYEAVMWRDYPLIQGVVLTAAVIVAATNLIVDILYAYLDPRIRYA